MTAIYNPAPVPASHPVQAAAPVTRPVTVTSSTPLPSLGSGRTWAVLGIGVIGLIWLAGTSWGPVVVAFLIAALVYEGIHGGPVQSFLNWLNGG